MLRTCSAREGGSSSVRGEAVLHVRGEESEVHLASRASGLDVVRLLLGGVAGERGERALELAAVEPGLIVAVVGAETFGDARAELRGGGPEARGGTRGAGRAGERVVPRREGGDLTRERAREGCRSRDEGERGCAVDIIARCLRMGAGANDGFVEARDHAPRARM